MKKIKVVLLTAFLFAGAVTASYAEGCINCINSSNDGHCQSYVCSIYHMTGDACCGNHI